MFPTFACIAFLFACTHCFAFTQYHIINSINENAKVSSNLNIPEANSLTESSLIAHATVICNETQVCENGGTCFQYACLCLPGTSGSLCEVIDDCKNGKLCREDRYTECEYSVEEQKAYCHCRRGEYRFDEATRTCRDCLCTPTGHQDLKSFSYCEYKQGQQICTCTEGYASTYDDSEKKMVCKACDCDSNSTWCRFDDNGRKMCGCHEGYFFNGDNCTECLCGNHGVCVPKVTCICDEGYAEYNGVCVECSCGKYGTCLYDEHSKQLGCKCETGYTENFGRCEKCYCGDNANCTFNGTEKICVCESGYEDVNGFCTDINECERHNPCNESMTCINLPGSYKCICKKGYMPVAIETVVQNRTTCQDVDECSQNYTVCAQPNTFCDNTIGSFNCLCKSGFVSRGMLDSTPSCEESTTKNIYIFIGIVSFGILLLLGTAVYHLKKTFEASHPGDLQEMK